MGKINILDFHVANLIAAGEVVDRPASVIKELLENAIDAGSSLITVETKRGGINYMRVSDNGCGMSHEDVPVSLKRHATSKLHTAKDLDSIFTLGFRGEALAAISSVSKLRMMTKQRDDATGTLLRSEGGTVVSVEDVGCPDGTTVIVEELFFNTPARMKFLKRDITETIAIVSVVEKIALSHPDISIRLICDGEIRFSTIGDGRIENTIYAVLGRDFTRRMLEIRGGFDGVEVYGFIGNPENIRSNRNMQIYFINHRCIRSATISSALEQAFATYIPAKKFPCSVMYLRLHPSFVDVNVHPAKLEVKFSNDKLIFNAVYYTVLNTLKNALIRPAMELGQDDEARSLVNAFVPVEVTDNSAGRQEHLRPLPSAHEEENNPVQSVVKAAAGDADEPPFSLPTIDDSVLNELRETAGRRAYKAVTEPDGNTADGEGEGENPQTVPFVTGEISRLTTQVGWSEDVHGDKGVEQDSDASSAELTEEPVAFDETEASETPAAYRMIGEVFYSYLLVESGDLLLLIDKHAAHERILFEKLRENGRKSQPYAQLLLAPIEISLDTVLLDTVSAYRAEIEQTGYRYEIDDKNVKLLQIPSFLDASDASDVFCEMASRLSESTGNAELTREVRYEWALFQASCKAAVKAGRQDDEAHLQWICHQVMTRPEIKFCPHGRPVCFSLTKAEISRRFGRE